jgi:hypothetical protein
MLADLKTAEGSLARLSQRSMAGAGKGVDREGDSRRRLPGAISLTLRLHALGTA